MVWAFFVGDFMAIQTINLAVPGGDTPRSANTKINANFTDQTNAASRLVGTGAEQIPLSQYIGKLSDIFNPDTTMYQTAKTGDANNFEVGSKYLVTSDKALNCPTGAGSTRFLIETRSMAYSTFAQLQIATVYHDRVGQYIRVKQGDNWFAWQPLTITPATYTTTTAAGANVVVDATGSFMRSTSSERYKDILAPLVLDDAKYAQAMALKPIVYRSTADADNPNHHYYSFSAEELGAYDPAFTLWRTTEMVEDAEGNITEQPLAEKQAEGLNINALLAMSHAIAIKQDKLIKKLEERVAALEPKPVTNNP